MAIIANENKGYTQDEFKDYLKKTIDAIVPQVSELKTGAEQSATNASESAESAEQSATDAQKAASAATDAKNAAQTYAQQAEATANAIKEKSILAITDSVQLAINTKDGGLDLVITTNKED